MKNPLIKIGLVIGLVLTLTISAFALPLGVFNLAGYNSSTVNSVMASYNTPAKIVSYMASNFSYVTFHASAWSPYNFYVNKWGDCNDFSTYGLYCAYKVAGYPKGALKQIYIVHTDGTSHMLAVYATQYSSNKSIYSGFGGQPTTAMVDHYDTTTSRTVGYAKIYSYDGAYEGTYYP